MEVLRVRQSLFTNDRRKMFIGGYGYSSPNQNSPPSPTRGGVWRSACSPFRNTNTPLQDITMSETLPIMNGANVRSPGKTSPASGIGGASGMAGAAGGRTMKEYEDQLRALKKENFNLKLRIYFLEERMGITSADEDPIRTNIELKVELESLRKELVEKQELLSQAAKAFELIETQKQTWTREQTQYEQSLNSERGKIAQLEKELEECKQRYADGSIYCKESHGISPEEALENEEKLHQMEELVSSLEAEVKQVTASLEEERSWAQELENERDEFRNRLENECRLRENLVAEKVHDIDQMREELKVLEEQVFKKDTIVQQYKNELSEKDRIIKQRNAQFEEKCQAHEELTAITEKRKKQIDQLRASVKARDDAFTDLNNKHRTLLSQFENGYGKRSPPNSPTAVNQYQGNPLSPKMGQKQSCTKTGGSPLDWEPNRERSMKLRLPQQVCSSSMDGKDTQEMAKELEDRELELRRQEEARKQLTLKLCNMQKQAEVGDQKLRKLEVEHEKAIKTIQGFMERQQQLEDRCTKKERKIIELELELNRVRAFESSIGMRNGHDFVRRDLTNGMTDDPERDPCNQQRFEEMESKINDLRDQIETIKAEKSRLEKQIQVEAEELQGRLHDKEHRIEVLEIEKHTMKEELRDKIAELDKLKETSTEVVPTLEPIDREKLLNEVNLRDVEIKEKNQRIEQLTKDLQVKTQNLQKLVNTELWSKNKEIAKLHNHMTATQCLDKSRNKSDIVQDSIANNQLSTLVKELNDIGIRVTFTNDIIQLNYVNGSQSIDAKTMTDYVQRLVAEKNQLEKEVDYLKWLKLVSMPDIAAEMDGCGNETERAKKYCELLRTHLKDLVKFMKVMLKNADHADSIGNEHKKIVLDVLLNSQILSDDFVHALEGMSVNDMSIDFNATRPGDDSVRKSRSENLLELAKNQTSTQSDSEAFSEPDRTVSLARIGLQEIHQKSMSRCRFTKYSKTFSDSEDSMDYVPYHKTYQTDLNDIDAGYQIHELKETNNLLYSELHALRNELVTKIMLNSEYDGKLAPLLSKLEKSQKYSEKLRTCLEKRMQECYVLKKENKQNSMRKVQLEKKIMDVENMALEAVNKQKTDLLQYKENTERKTMERLVVLTKENDMLRSRIKKLEDETEAAKEHVATLTKELDHLTLSHSQMLVENTKLTNDKLRLEQEGRKSENRYDMAIRTLHDKFHKEISDLNQINDSHRTRMHELEAANKELRRHVAICEASDSAPSSSGVSSIPTDGTLKQPCEDILQEYQPYNSSQYWLPINYPTFGGRSKSSCSPDLGIESDAALTATRPLQNTLKITESMTNLFSDEDNANSNHGGKEVDSESPLPMEGLDEIEALKQENETLKRRLMKTRRALEDTFQHLSASNKNKKNVEKALSQQLMMTKSVLKKTRIYEEPLGN